MVIQYPHLARIIKPGESVKVNGNFIQEPDQIEYETTCRIEPASSNQYRKGTDGRDIIFTSVVYMPLPREITGSLTPTPGSSETVVYAGRKFVHVVTEQEAGGDTVILPELSGRKFYLRLDLLPLVESEYEPVPGGGFKVVGIGELIAGQRFEVETYYEVTINTPSGPISVGGGYFIKPGTTVEVWNGNYMVTKDTVKQFSKGQLNMRLWL